MKSTQNNELEDRSDVLEHDHSHTNSNAELDEAPGTQQPQQDVNDTVKNISMDKPDEIAPNESSEISIPSAELLENQSAPETDSTTTGSSNATPFLSPVGELTDDSPSDEMSAYLTPPSELAAESVNEEQAVHSSPESDRNDNRRRYAYPEIQLGDIHKVNSLVIFSYPFIWRSAPKWGLQVARLPWIPTCRMTQILHIKNHILRLIAL